MPDAAPFALELKKALPDHSIRRLAKDSGWGRSTVHEWMSGVRIPNPDQLNDLLDVGAVPGSERKRLHQLRDQAAEEGDAAETAGVTVELADLRAATVSADAADLSPGSAGTDLTSGRTDPPDTTEVSDSSPDTLRTVAGHPRPLVVTVMVGVFVAGLLTAGAFAGGYALALRHGGVELVRAEVVDTDGLGVIAREAPTTTSAQRGSFAEGDQLQVICVVNNGESHTSPQTDVTSSVWALLDDGTWIFDLYLDTPKSHDPTQPPPAPLRLCGQL